MLHLHLNTPQPRLSHREPLFLALRAYDFTREEAGGFEVVAGCELFELLAGFGCCDVELRGSGATERARE